LAIFDWRLVIEKAARSASSNQKSTINNQKSPILNPVRSLFPSPGQSGGWGFKRINREAIPDDVPS